MIFSSTIFLYFPINIRQTRCANELVTSQSSTDSIIHKDLTFQEVFLLSPSYAMCIHADSPLFMHCRRFSEFATKIRYTSTLLNILTNVSKHLIYVSLVVFHEKQANFIQYCIAQLWYLRDILVCRHKVEKFSVVREFSIWIETEGILYFAWKWIVSKSLPEIPGSQWQYSRCYTSYFRFSSHCFQSAYYCTEPFSLVRGICVPLRYVPSALSFLEKNRC